MDPVKLIKQDHRAVKALFRSFERSTRRDQKQRIAQQIIEELSVHSAMEETLVYPMLRQCESRLEDPVLNALEEHHAAKLILAELDGMKVDEERFDAKMHVLRESVEMHIEEEETRLLPRLEKLLDAETGKQLAEEMLAAKESAPNHPHPHAPDTPPAAIVSALVARVTDAGKDLVRKVTNRAKAAGHRMVKRRAKATARKTRSRGAAARRTGAAARARKRTASKARRRRAGARRTGARKRARSQSRRSR